MLKNVLSPLSESVYAALRVVAGVMFAFHGVQKVFGVLSEYQPEVMSQLWIGGVIELVGGLLIAIGLFTRWAAFISSGTMAVAYIQFHWKFAFDSSFFPTINEGELALLYSFVFLFIAAKGVGCCGVDSRSEG